MSLQALARDRSGGVLVEATVLIPIIFIFVLGSVDFLFAFFQWNATTKPFNWEPELPHSPIPYPPICPPWQGCAMAYCRAIQCRPSDACSRHRTRREQTG